jgi:toxin ParE1/3/4
VAERRTIGFRLSPAAQDDLDGIFDYTVRQWGLEQAVRYTRSIEEACTRLAQTPTLAQDCAYIRPGYRRGVVGRHVIYFRVEDYGIAIIRILHRRMDAPRHL